MDSSLLLWLLLPIAAMSGWLAARHSLSSYAENVSRQRSSHYLKGLNFLINEQPDKAIDIFIKLLDVDGETVETHLALGALFRRRGEVNRAIKIHQNLTHRNSLDIQQRSLAMLELGKDYQRAGLLDRAETLYQELIDAGQCQSHAYRRLMGIYQQEQDWDNAINAADRLARHSGEDLNAVIAHYHCEQAEQYRNQTRLEQTSEAVEKALQIDSMCVRASLLEGQLAMTAGEYTSAVRSFRRIEHQNADYLSEALPPLGQCYEQLEQNDEYIAYLHYILKRYGGFTTMQQLASHLQIRQGEQMAIGFIVDYLKTRPSVRGLAYFLDLALSTATDTVDNNLHLLRDMTTQLLKDKPMYQCTECGFNGKVLHWQCPSCLHWGVIRPIRGIDGE